MNLRFVCSSLTFTTQKVNACSPWTSVTVVIIFVVVVSYFYAIKILFHELSYFQGHLEKEWDLAIFLSTITTHSQNWLFYPVNREAGTGYHWYPSSEFYLLSYGPLRAKLFTPSLIKIGWIQEKRATGHVRSTTLELAEIDLFSLVYYEAWS